VKERDIAIVAARVGISEQPRDFASWSSQPRAARLEELERIRRDYHAWKYGEEPRLQKVCTILKR
jgi:hypothetical protein